MLLSRVAKDRDIDAVHMLRLWEHRGWVKFTEPVRPDALVVGQLRLAVESASEELATMAEAAEARSREAEEALVRELEAEAQMQSSLDRKKKKAKRKSKGDPAASNIKCAKQYISQRGCRDRGHDGVGDGNYGRDGDSGGGGRCDGGGGLARWGLSAQRCLGAVSQPIRQALREGETEEIEGGGQCDFQSRARLAVSCVELVRAVEAAVRGCRRQERCLAPPVV